MGKEMKHFIDIENLRDVSVDLGEGVVRERNDQAFLEGDIISITEKVDGSNASMRYDVETNTLKAFSRSKVLDYTNTLEGFFNFVQGLNPTEYADTPNYVIFGEWLRKNKITYNAENMKKWYVYSIYDVETEQWLPQTDVKAFAEKHNLIYVHELYYGPFISWEHCRGFMNSPQYGDTQEGIVVRNLSALKRGERYPHVLKIVNDSFKETMKQHIKIVDPEKMAAKNKAEILIKGIITRSRVEKMILKLRDEGIIGDNLTPQDMSIVSKYLPKRIIEDCIKEEPEVVQSCGEYFGKLSGSITMQLARAIIIGS